MHVSIGLSSCKCEYMFLSVYVCLCVYLDMCIYVQFYPFVCQNMRMHAFISLSVYTCACRYVSISGFLLVCLSVCLHMPCTCMYNLSVCPHMHTHVSISVSTSLNMHMCSQKSPLTPLLILSYLEVHIFFWVFILLCACERERLSQICAGLSEPSLLENATHIKIT